MKKLIKKPKQSKTATLKFLGAAGTVTGSKYLINVAGNKFLLDCGLFQGIKELRERNWQPPPFKVRELECVVLSHAHIDHSGYLPLIVRNGFRGPIYCTSSTADLLHELLPDAAHLQEEEAAYANFRGYSKHQPAQPLYTSEDAQNTLELLEIRKYHQSFSVLEGVQITYRRAGHILGAASIEVKLVQQRKSHCLVFSGDLGRYDQPMLHDPESVERADTLILESTYGDRSHPKRVDQTLATIVTEAHARGGALIIPAFAVGRVQELIWRLRMLEIKNKIPSLPIYIDSPMASNVTRIYCEHPEDHDIDMKLLLDANRCPLNSGHVRFTRSADESRSLNNMRGPMIIIAGSGMATGGRVLHHLKLRLGSSKTTVLFVGFQAEGTRGRFLQGGAKSIKIHGQDVPVRARVITLEGLSAHAGQSELTQWLRGFVQPPGQTYLVHGEPPSLNALASHISGKFNWKVRVAQDSEEVDLFHH